MRRTSRKTLRSPTGAAGSEDRKGLKQNLHERLEVANHSIRSRRKVQKVGAPCVSEVGSVDKQATHAETRAKSHESERP